jgi:hypothetical protein
MALRDNLHGYGESLFNKWGIAPDWPRHALWRISQRADIKICVGENRASSIPLELRMAGQVDLLMRNEDSTEYHILDYKFIKEPRERVTTTDLLGSIK